MCPLGVTAARTVGRHASAVVRGLASVSAQSRILKSHPDPPQIHPRSTRIQIPRSTPEPMKIDENQWKSMKIDENRTPEPMKIDENR